MSKNWRTMTADALDRRDRTDKLYLAEIYVPVERCKLCGHLGQKGYICWHCGKDDSTEESQS